MSNPSRLDLARAAYKNAVTDFGRAKDRVTKAKRALALLEGKARTPEQIANNRLAQRRQQVLRANPHLRQITSKAARRDAVDAILAKRDAACVWRFYLDTMHHDPITRALKIYAQNRARFELYKAGLTLARKLILVECIKSTEAAEIRQLRDNARTIELHLQTLVDAAPREVTLTYPQEWRVISRALRPEGMRPQSKGAKRLLALYQHIVRTHTVEGHQWKDT